MCMFVYGTCTRSRFQRQDDHHLHAQHPGGQVGEVLLHAGLLQHGGRIPAHCAPLRQLAKRRHNPGAVDGAQSTQSIQRGAIRGSTSCSSSCLRSSEFQALMSLSCPKGQALEAHVTTLTCTLALVNPSVPSRAGLQA